MKSKVEQTEVPVLEGLDREISKASSRSTAKGEMKTINSVNELPTRPDIVFPDGRTVFHTGQIFVRSKIDPWALIESHDGEVYRRADGQNWEWPAYKREREIDLVDGIRTPKPWSKPKGCPAIEDDKIYAPAKAKAVGLTVGRAGE